MEKQSQGGRGGRGGLNVCVIGGGIVTPSSQGISSVSGGVLMWMSKAFVPKMSLLDAG